MGENNKPRSKKKMVLATGGGDSSQIDYREFPYLQSVFPHLWSVFPQIWSPIFASVLILGQQFSIFN